MLGFHPVQYQTPKWLAQVDIEMGFYFHDGPIVRSLLELRSSLLSVSDASFTYHVHDATNDVAVWVAEAVGDIPLGDILAATKHRWDMIIALEQYMQLLPTIPGYLAQRWLRNAGHKGFSFSHGWYVLSMTHLVEILDKASNEDIIPFWKHKPNDLSIWINEVLGDYELAKRLESHEPVVAVIATVVRQRVKELQSYIS